MRFAYVVFVFKQKTAYDMRISGWSSDVCSSDLLKPQAATRPVAASVATMRKTMRLRAKWNTRNSVILAGSIMTETEFLALVDQILDSIESQAATGRASCRERVFQSVES